MPPPEQRMFSMRIGLRLGGLGFPHPLLQALGAAMTTAVQFFFPFDFLVSHSYLQGNPHIK